MSAVADRLKEKIDEWHKSAFEEIMSGDPHPDLTRDMRKAGFEWCVFRRDWYRIDDYTRR